MRTYAYTIHPLTKPVHLRLSDLRGFHRLASEATVGLTDLVEAMHHTIARAPGVVGESPKGRTSGITGLVYKLVRGVTRLVGGGIDALLGVVASLIAERPSSQQREPLWRHSMACSGTIWSRPAIR